jgi:hypothetical protein
METKRKIEAWEELFIKYRFTEMAVLYFEALRIGLMRGSITAEDLHHIPVQNPNVRGAVMKGLKRGGMFEKEAVEYGTTKQSHGHSMFRWRLTDRSKASKILSNKVIQTFSFCEPDSGWLPSTEDDEPLFSASGENK